MFLYIERDGELLTTFPLDMDVLPAVGDTAVIDGVTYRVAARRWKLKRGEPDCTIVITKE